MPDDNIPSQKYCDTGIPQYFLTSSIVDNFNKNPTVWIISALADSLSHNCVLMILYVLTFCLWTWLSCCWHLCWSFNVCWWPAADLIYMVIYVECCGKYLASPRYIIPSLLIPRIFLIPVFRASLVCCALAEVTLCFCHAVYNDPLSPVREPVGNV